MRSPPRPPSTTAWPSPPFRTASRRVDDDENVNFYGTHSADVDGELAEVDADGYRPLCAPSALTTVGQATPTLSAG